MRWKTKAISFTAMMFLMALEGGRPLTLLGGQLMWVMQPVLSLFIATDTVRQTAQLLEDPIAVDALIARLQVDDL